MPAPIHNPDGSESPWCYTKPTSAYGDYRDALGHFPLKHFWGPLAHIRSSEWIAESGAIGAEQYRPNFFYFYLPQLDYAAQKHGPDSEAALTSCRELDEVIGRLAPKLNAVYPTENPLWLVASDYSILPVNHVLYPNRLLRDAGLLTIAKDVDGREQLDFANCRAWALVDHQCSHVFVDDAQDIGRVVDVLREQEGIDEILVGEERERYQMAHERAGEIVVASQPNSWQAYDWWHDDHSAPSYARTVDIHRKPGYDPVELYFDRKTMSTPLDATLVQGSHGAPAQHPSQRGVLLSSQKGVFVEGPTADTDVFEIVLRQFGI